MEVCWGALASGLWSNNAEGWLSWCYPFPRAVHALCVVCDSMELDAYHLRLGACLPGQDDFTLVGWQTSAALPGSVGAPPHCLLLATQVTSPSTATLT